MIERISYGRSLIDVDLLLLSIRRESTGNDSASGYVISLGIPRDERMQYIPLSRNIDGIGML